MQTGRGRAKQAQLLHQVQDDLTDTARAPISCHSALTSRCVKLPPCTHALLPSRSPGTHSTTWCHTPTQLTSIKL